MSQIIVLLVIAVISFAWTAATLQQQQQQAFTKSLPSPFTSAWLTRLHTFYNTWGHLHATHDQDLNMLEDQCAFSLPDFACDGYDMDDGIQDRDAYQLRPKDIKAVIALGDSITAGFGMLSGRPPFASVWEYRGKVFSMGGDPDEGYTLPHFFSKAGMLGASTGVTVPLSQGSALNNAVSGAKAQDLDHQVTRLIEQFDHHPSYKALKSQWKVITLLVGANNVCVLCTPPFTQLPGMADVDLFETHVRSTLNRLHHQVGKSFVNLVALFNVSSVYEASRGNAYCQMVLDPSHMVICSCLQADEEKRKAADLVVRGYNDRLALIAQDYQALHDPDFAVSYQPGFTMFPVGKYKQRYLSGIDCFHPNRCANQVMATVLWNNMFSSPAEKLLPYHVSNLTFVCPGPDRPYLQ